MSVKYSSIKNALLYSNDPDDPQNKKDGFTSNAVSLFLVGLIKYSQGMELFNIIFKIFKL